ncbi:hypothetical protein [Streptomyces griseorubiginosus]|uniref:hypothetical protein n=1 Tax=Streptomyces griseorubiginosus TaxID=67304 RepID=UPI0036E7680D
MADELEKTPVQDRVRQQFDDEIAANRREQEEVTEQIAGLQERLEQLRADEAWLTQAQGSLPGALTPSEPAAERDGASTEQPEISASAEAATDTPHTVPQPRQDQSEKAAQPKQAAKKAPAKKTTAKKTAAKKTAADPAPAPEDTTTETPAKKSAAEEKSGPPLWELILGILLKTPGEPCVAREVTDQLSQDHPARATSIQTVRNNLETLVKKKLAEKSHQQGSAMYTAYTDAGAPSAPAADEPEGGEGEPAPQAEAEKVPAEV